MIVLLAADSDGAAFRLAERWRVEGLDVRELDMSDLARPGWRFEPSAPERWRGVVGGTTVTAADVDAVVSRRPGVVGPDLPWFAAEDREYAAAEVNAFLLAWLSSLRCPVVNRPTPMSLAGAGWSEVEWQRQAAEAGLPVRPLRRFARNDRARDAAVSGPPPPWTVPPPAGRCVCSIVGARCLSAPSPELAAAAHRLAAAAGADLLRVELDPDPDRPGALAVHNVDVWVDLGDPEIARALRAHLALPEAAA
jgi:hypothetical protein